MCRRDKLAINYFLIKKIHPTKSNELHVRSFLKNASTNSIKKIIKRVSRILYNFLSAVKRILLKYKSFYRVNLEHRKKKLLLEGYLFNTNISYTVLPFQKTKHPLLHMKIKDHKLFLSQYRNFFILFYTYHILVTTLHNTKIKFVSLPTTVTKKTVLRSPHIDKRSREQFERNSSHSMTYIPSFFSDLSSILKYSIPSFGTGVTQKNTLIRQTK